METETQTVVAIVPATPADKLYGKIAGLAIHGRLHYTLSRDQLQALAQQAYDQFGILAEPSLEVESERFDRLQAEAADEHVRAFADAWGRSIGDQS